jgi:hypothetical protein
MTAFLLMCGFSIAAWLAASSDRPGLAILVGFVALITVTVLALASLGSDRSCLVCGRPYRVGRLGMHEGCARETRLTRR